MSTSFPKSDLFHSNVVNLILFIACVIPTHVFSQFHPADSDSDMIISLSEMTAYAKAWTEGTEWPSEPSPVTDEFYGQAEFLWQKGEKYRQIEGAP